MNKEITAKAILYAVPLFLTPFVDKLADMLLNDQWPSLAKLAGCALLGTVSTSIGLRAFYDGSYERSKPISPVNLGSSEDVKKTNPLPASGLLSEAGAELPK